MWEIIPGKSVGPICIGMSKNQYVDILGDKFEVFKRFEDSDDEVIAYEDKGVHLTVDSNHSIKQVTVFDPNEISLIGVQLLGRDIASVSKELSLKGLIIQKVDAGIYCEDQGIILVDVDGYVDGVEVLAKR